MDSVAVAVEVLLMAMAAVVRHLMMMASARPEVEAEAAWSSFVTRPAFRQRIQQAFQEWMSSDLPREQIAHGACQMALPALKF
jgi:hypothetical protein